MDEMLQTQKKPEVSAVKVARAKRLGTYTRKWMMALLWLCIPNGIANSLTLNPRFAEVPLFYTVGSVIGYVCMGLELYFLMKMRWEEDEYVVTVKFGAGAMGLLVISELLFMPEDAGLVLYFIALFVNCAATVLYCIRIYHECYAHASLMLSVDKAMAEKWLKLWQWMVIGHAGILVGTLLQVYQRLDRVLLTVKIGIVLSVVMFFVSAIAGLFRLAYLEKSAKLLREYAKRYTV